MGDVPPPFDALWFQLLIGFVVGITLGSFITMLSYRLPRKLSIVLPPSSCPQCRAPLKVRDLVPVFSWLITGGKCSQCGAKIGRRYLLIELITGIMSAIAFGVIGFRWELAVVLIFIVTLVTFLTICFEKKQK